MNGSLWLIDFISSRCFEKTTTNKLHCDNMWYSKWISCKHLVIIEHILTECIWTASSEFGTHRLCEQRRFRRACAFAQSRQNLRCSLIQAVSQQEPSDRKPDPWPLWMAGHAQLKFVMTECSKTQIRLTGLICENIWVGERTVSCSSKIVKKKEKKKRIGDRERENDSEFSCRYPRSTWSCSVRSST